ncbi:MAG: metal-sensitive transcriptional regulator [Bdellovibrionales bacterium]|jgi:DNA-binding FrmR family transcriptional regulator|nr:metal-sensitive transcriptional regulator [Bdellovibrionales bacterium]
MAKKISDRHKHIPHGETLVRIKRASGHLRKVETMVSDGAECVEVLQQLSAVISALESCRISLLQDHFRSCITPAIRNDSQYLIKDLETVIRRALK